jgi:hypothetical protein
MLEAMGETGARARGAPAALALHPHAAGCHPRDRAAGAAGSGRGALGAGAGRPRREKTATPWLSTSMPASARCSGRPTPARPIMRSSACWGIARASSGCRCGCSPARSTTGSSALRGRRSWRSSPARSGSCRRGRLLGLHRRGDAARPPARLPRGGRDPALRRSRPRAHLHRPAPERPRAFGDAVPRVGHHARADREPGAAGALPAARAVLAARLYRRAQAQPDAAAERRSSASRSRTSTRSPSSSAGRRAARRW